jgi:eukaryotic translation initiation factor 2C
VQVGRSFFTPPRGEVLKLGDGLEMWYGIFQSATLGWKPFVNVDGKCGWQHSALNIVNSRDQKNFF